MENIYALLLLFCVVPIGWAHTKAIVRAGNFFTAVKLKRRKFHEVPHRKGCNIGGKKVTNVEWKFSTADFRYFLLSSFFFLLPFKCFTLTLKKARFSNGFISCFGSCMGRFKRWIKYYTYDNPNWAETHTTRWVIWVDVTRGGILNSQFMKIAILNQLKKSFKSNTNPRLGHLAIWFK